ncbi:MAG: hypothetical protein P1U64_11725 [Alcanivoracaceae bacterium]|nr:hypothetical protein [Alcanivoracaceae bacterium]
MTIGQLDAKDTLVVCGILGWQEEGIDAAAKYFLIRVYWLYGCDPMRQTLKKLSGRVGMSPKVVSRSRDLLLDKSVLSAVRVLSVSKKTVGDMRAGRCRAGFRLEKQSLQAWITQASDKLERQVPGPLRSAALAELFFEQLPEKLDRPEPGRPAGQAHHLSPENKVLLGVLWNLADEHGVVQGDGLSTLAGLSGLSMVQVRNQIRKLERLGHVLGRVPGASCKGMFGKAEGAIFLAPPRKGEDSGLRPPLKFRCAVGFDQITFAHKRAAELRKLEPSSVPKDGGQAPGRSNRSVYEKLVGDLKKSLLRASPYLKSIPAPKSPGSESARSGPITITDPAWGSFPRLDQVLMDDFVGPGVRYIRAKVVAYAADILNESQDSSVFDTFCYARAPDQVLNRIEREAITPKFLKAFSQQQASALVALLYGWAWHVARAVHAGVKHMLDKVSADAQRSGHFVIFPIRATEDVQVLYFESHLQPGMLAMSDLRA